ncbi:MAG TPA: hypothetical protein VLC52_05105 [Anaerolineae bacterium]|nr:hypothetical protein [Anaerolineae bacterium]
MTHAGEQRGQPSDLVLWLGVSAPPIAWFLHLNLVYVLVPVTCGMGGHTAMVVVSLVMAGVCVAAGIVSWLGWRGLRQEERRMLFENMEGTRTSFMLFGAVLSSGLFLFAIVLATLPILFVNPCFPTEGI